MSYTFFRWSAKGEKTLQPHPQDIKWWPFNLQGGWGWSFFRGQIFCWNLILVRQNSMIEFMIIGNLPQRKEVAHIFPIELLNQNFSEIDSIWNLGVAFDPAFLFKKHVLNICRSAFYHIRDLRRIRIHLNKATAISLANALVSSRLDYCNSLLFCCS